MANWQTLEEMRREGFEVAECDRRLGPVLVKDLYGFGDVMGYDPVHVMKKRLVNGCQADLQEHIRKYLDGGVNEKTGKPFPPNKHLKHLILEGFDLFIYSFVLRTMRDSDNKLLKRKVYVCRKWQAILSPEGKVSFEKCPSETESS
jgi:hypothetical protein